MQQAIADMAILDAFGPDYLRKHLGLLARAELLVLDTNLKNSTLECLFGQLPEQRFFVDCVSSSKAPKIRPFLSRIHTLKPNLAEAEAILFCKNIKAKHPFPFELLSLEQEHKHDKVSAEIVDGKSGEM